MDTNFDVNSIWEAVLKRRDIFEVNDFIQEYPWIDNAYSLFQELKEEELKLIPINHSSRCLALIESNIFSVDELVEGGMLTKQSYEKILNKDKFLFCHQFKYPNDYYNFTNYNEDVTVTDVFLFGVGHYEERMSILQGILTSSLFKVDNQGAFVEHFHFYSEEGYLFHELINTPSWFTPIISGTIKNNCCINFIAPSFDFTTNCITNKSIGDTVEAQILKNNHKKIFFFIIDPTTELCVFNREVETCDEDGNVDTEIQTIRVRQSSRLKEMLDLLELDSNKEIMKNVDSAHFIMCNAEKLSETGYHMIKEYYHIHIRILHDICKYFNINKQNKHMPNFYPFSLGSFFTNDVYEYDSSDSDKILETIYNHCTKQNMSNGILFQIREKITSLKSLLDRMYKGTLNNYDRLPNCK